MRSSNQNPRRTPSHSTAARALLTLMCAGAALMSFPSTAHAAAGTWTSLSSGLWSNTANWSTLADGSGFTADFSTLDLATADITVSLDSARTIGNLTFGDTATATAFGWTLDNNASSANILTLAGTSSPTITVGTLGTAKVATISLELAGTQGLTKAGAGQLTLSGVNTYSGTTNINAGTLAFSGSGTALNSTGITVGSGATVSITNTNAANSTNRIADGTAITMNGGLFSFTSDAIASTSYTETAGQLALSSGSNRVTTTTANATAGVSTLTFASLNRTAGSTVTFTNITNLASSRNQIIFTTAPTLDSGNLIGGWATAGSADFATYGANGVAVATSTSNPSESTWATTQNIKLTTGQTLTADRQINSLVTHTGAGGIALNLGGFTLRVESGGVLGSQSANGNTTISNGNLTAGYTANTAAELFLLNSQFNTRPGTISANVIDNGTGAVSVVLNASVNNSNGQIILSGNNTYTGTTNLLAGLTTLGASTAINNSKALTVATGASIATGGFNVTVDGLSGGGSIGSAATNNSIISVGNNNGNATYSGSFTVGSSGRNLNIVKNGTGTQILSGSDFRDVTTTGSPSTTTINNGTLQFAKQVSLYNNNTARWNTTNVIVNSGGTLALNVGGTGEFTSANVDTIKALGTATGGFKSGAILGLDTTNAGGNFAYSSAIGNTFAGANVLGLTKLGTGTLTVSGANTYTGATTINAGTLALGASNVLATGTAITLGGGTLNLGGFSQAAFTNALTMTAGSTIDFGSHVGGLTLTFGDSKAASWTGTLTLLNFTAGTDNLNFTSIGGGVTSTQLSQIGLSGYTATGFDGSGNVQFTISSVPEPATYAALAGLGILGFAACRRRRA